MLLLSVPFPLPCETAGMHRRDQVFVGFGAGSHPVQLCVGKRKFAYALSSSLVDCSVSIE